MTMIFLFLIFKYFVTETVQTLSSPFKVVEDTYFNTKKISPQQLSQTSSSDNGSNVLGKFLLIQFI